MNRPDANSPSRRWRTPALVALGAWLAIEVLFTLHAETLDALEAMKLILPRLLVWLIFAPLAVWLAFRFPLERGRLAWSLAVHLTACVVLVVVGYFALVNFVGVATESTANGSSSQATPSIYESGNRGRSSVPPTPTSGHRIRRSPLVARLTLDLLFYGVIVSSCQSLAWSRRAKANGSVGAQAARRPQ